MPQILIRPADNLAQVQLPPSTDPDEQMAKPPLSVPWAVHHLGLRQ